MGGNQLPEPQVVKQRTQLCLLRPLDDEVPVEILMTDLDVLHTEPLGDVAEQSTTVNREPEVLGIHVGCSQSGENHCGFTGGYRVSIQRDGPLIVRGLHLVSLPKARSEEHTSELQSHHDLVCRLLLEKKKKKKTSTTT